MRRFALAAVAVMLVASAAHAQDIDDLDEGVVLETPFVTGIEPNVWEFNLQVGFLDLANSLVGADGIIVDLEGATEAIYGNMTLEGESSFHPQMRFNRTFGTHLALENTVGFAIGDYLQSVDRNSLEKWIEADDENNVLTEFELEKGSYFVWMHEHSLVWYPRGEGRLQPYLLAGAGTQTYFLDSRYVDGSSNAFAFSYGAGLRIIGDDLYSFKLEVRNYHTNISYKVAEIFETRQNLKGDGLIKFPVSRLVDGADLTEEQVRALVEQLDLDSETVITPGFDVNWLIEQAGELGYNSARLPAQYDGLEEESYTNLYVSFGFSAAF